MDPIYQPIRSPEPKKPDVMFIIGAFALLLIIVFVMGGAFNKKKADVHTLAPDNILVAKTDLSVTQGNARLPIGFPSDIPVETKDAYESYSMDYKDKNVVQYSVSFMSSQAFDKAYQTYKDYLVSGGYTAKDAGASTNSQKTVWASRNGDDLLVVISKDAGKVRVQISYLDRS